MNADEFLPIKKLAMLAMFSEEPLLSTLVLKGGNLLDLVYGVAPRSSIDLDFSMERDFAPGQMPVIRHAIQEALSNTFSASGYHVFDITFVEKPRRPPPDMPSFWGGYRIEFKVIPRSLAEKYKGQERELRVRALRCGTGGRLAFSIDISKFEYCKTRRAREIEGQTIYIYTPEMLVFEKLRAICQQMPEYAAAPRTATRTARARDFFDIVAILRNFRLTLPSAENLDLARHIFEAKAVPLRLIGLIPGQREYHRSDFLSVQGTVKPGVLLRDFDFYFDYVLEHCVGPLESLWKVDSPAA